MVRGSWLSFVTEELPERKGLEILRLAGNPSLEIDIEEIVARCPSSITKLFLDGTGCCGDGRKATWTRLERLEMINLTNTKIKGTEEQLRQVLPLSCQRIYAAEGGWDGSIF